MGGKLSQCCGQVVPPDECLHGLFRGQTLDMEVANITTAEGKYEQIIYMQIYFSIYLLVYLSIGPILSSWVCLYNEGHWS